MNQRARAITHYALKVLISSVLISKAGKCNSLFDAIPPLFRPCRCSLLPFIVAGRAASSIPIAEQQGTGLRLEPYNHAMIWVRLMPWKRPESLV
jgi:hypothetical protein